MYNIINIIKETKLMKKFLSVMLMLAITISLLVSCGSKEPTAKDIVDAIKKTSDLESDEMDIDMEMSMSAEGMSFDIPMELTVKTAVVDGEEVIESEISMEMLGMAIETKTYTVDGYVYTETMGQKTKAPVDESDDSTPSFEITDFEEEDIESFEVSEDDDGTKFDIVLKKGALDDQLGGMLGEDMIGESEVSYKDIKMAVVINDEGYVVKYEIEFEAESDEAGEISAKIDIEVKNPGKEVKIELPDDLDTYEEESDDYFDEDLGDLDEDMSFDEDLGDLFGDSDDLWN